METIDMLIGEIESEILKAKRATFSSTDIVINRQVMLDLVTRLRASYPIVLKEAEQIKKERDDILSKAEAYANKTMDAAEEQARAMMSDTEVLKKASEEAEAMRAEAEENYRKTEYQARALAFNILDNAEKTMKEGLSTIADRKRKLMAVRVRPWAALFVAFARMRLANMYTIACNAFAQNHSKIPHRRSATETVAYTRCMKKIRHTARRKQRIHSIRKSLLRLFFAVPY